MRYRLLIFIVLLATTPALLVAQNQEMQTDGWRGLVLDTSTPEDAVRILGKPSKDEDKVSVRIWGIDNWLSGKEKQKIFRTLSYKWGKVKGVQFVELAFLDGRLAIITLQELPTPDRRQAGWIDPDNLEKLFSVPFKPRKREASKNLPPLLEFQSAATTELSKYESYYDALGVADKSFIVALVDNDKDISGYVGIFGPDPTTGSREKEKKKIRKGIDAGGKYPGYVSALKIISRKLAVQ
jgi:hypothetical protein